MRGSTIAELERSVQVELERLYARLDQLAGLRGTSQLYGPLDAGDNRIMRVAAPEADSDGVPASHAIVMRRDNQHVRPTEQWDARGMQIFDVADADHDQDAIPFGQATRMVDEGLLGMLADSPPPDITSASATGTSTQAAREDHTHGTAIAGVYTPTLTNVANVAASTAYECQYLRLGASVVVSGKVDVDPTAAVATQLGISLPIASNIGAVEDCAGTAAGPGIAGQSAAIVGDAVNNRAELQWIAVDITNQPMFFIFMYQVL